MHPLALLPWPVFAALWMAAESGALVWLTAPLSWRWRIPVLLVCVPEVMLGNVYGFWALTAVLGLRRPELWTFALLTKITPGAMGLLCFAGRREWRKLARPDRDRRRLRSLLPAQPGPLAGVGGAPPLCRR